jgi:hypothetical protein
LLFIKGQDQAARHAGEVGAYRYGESLRLEQLTHLCLLAEPDLDAGNALWGEQPRQLRRETTIGVEAVLAGEQRSCRLPISNV